MANRLLFFLFCIVILLFSIEAFARLYLKLGDSPLVQTHPTIEYMFVPSQTAHPFGHLFKTNKYGMRSDDFTQNKSGPNEFRVLVVGDSVINGGNLTSQEALATSLLQKSLTAKLHKSVVVGNISAGSWGPPNEFAYIKQFGLFDADVVIFELSSEDYGDVPTFESLNPLTHPTRKPISAAIEGLIKYLPRYLSKNSKESETPSIIPSPSPNDIRACLQAEAEFLIAAVEAGVRPIVLQHWRMSELKNQRANAGHDEIRRIAERLQVAVYQDSDILQKYVEAGQIPYRDDIHPNDLGQRALAELLEEIVIREFDLTKNVESE